jgi:hypothetical protein
LTLKKVVREEHVEGARIIPSSDSNTYSAPQQGRQGRRQGRRGGQNKVMKVLSYTIIGRIISAFMNDKERDVEMQNQEHYVQK